MSMEPIRWPSLTKQVKDTGIANGREIQLTKTPVKGTSLTVQVARLVSDRCSPDLSWKGATAIGRISYTTGKIQLVHPRKDAAYEISYDLNEVLAKV